MIGLGRVMPRLSDGAAKRLRENRARRRNKSGRVAWTIARSAGIRPESTPDRSPRRLRGYHDLIYGVLSGSSTEMAFGVWQRLHVVTIILLGLMNWSTACCCGHIHGHGASGASATASDHVTSESHGGGHTDHGHRPAEDHHCHKAGAHLAQTGASPGLVALEALVEADACSAPVVLHLPSATRGEHRGGPDPLPDWNTRARVERWLI
jgi:hypothetical protein